VVVVVVVPTRKTKDERERTEVMREDRLA